MLHRVACLAIASLGFAGRTVGQALTARVQDSLEHECWRREFARPFWQGGGCQVVRVKPGWAHLPPSGAEYEYATWSQIEHLLTAEMGKTRKIFWLHCDIVAMDTLHFEWGETNWRHVPMVPIYRQLLRPRVWMAFLQYPRQWIAVRLQKPKPFFWAQLSCGGISDKRFDYRAYRVAATDRWVLRSWEEEIETGNAAHPYRSTDNR